MNTYSKIIPFLIFIWIAPIGHTQNSQLLTRIQTIPLKQVYGRIDHLSIDIKNHRLFLAALGNNTIEIIDLNAGRQTHTITELHEPQGVFYSSLLNKIYVANGASGECKVYDGESYQPIANVKVSGDADNVRYDSNSNLIYIGCESDISILNPISNQIVGTIQLKGHPESFQLESNGSRIFANIPSAHLITVINKEKCSVMANWPMDSYRSNFPMALDENDHQLFVGFRNPKKIVVFNTETAKKVDEIEIPGDIDDLFYDSQRHRIYASCGEGAIVILQRTGNERFTKISEIPAVSGARTSLWVPEFNRFYLAVPKRGDSEAAVWVYSISP